MPRGFDISPEVIPLFPLSGAVLLPRMRLPLQIFEPRYLQMVEDVLKTPDRLIGIIQPADGGGDALAQIGCAGRIIAFSEMDDNRLMISLRARSRFRVTQVQEGFAPYLRGQVDWRGFDKDLSQSQERAEGFDRKGFMARLARYADANGLNAEFPAAENAETELLVNSLCMMLPLKPGEKQALLQADTLAERCELLDGLLEYALRGGEYEERLQ